MEEYKTHNDGDPRRKRRSPTMSAAKALEQLVADQHSSTSSSRSSTSSRRFHPDHLSKPLPELNPHHVPPYQPPVPPHQSQPPIPPHQSKPPPHHPPHPHPVPPPFKTRRSSLPHPGYNRRPSPAADPTPTDSHPRHARSNPTAGGDTISTLLLLTNDRLTQETSRADAAERHARQLLVHLRTAHDVRARLDQDLVKVKTELGLYKAQLDVAQKEIFRAQEIVEAVERQRVAAEHQAKKDRDRARKLLEDKAVSEAMAEGRRMGFQEGLERGRLMALSDERRRRVYEEIDDDDEYETAEDGERFQSVPSSAQSFASPRTASDRAPSVIERAPSEPERVLPPIPQTREPSITRSRRTASATTNGRSRRPSSPSSQYGHVPDTGRFASSLPRPSITSPVDLRVPSTQPQPIPDLLSRPELARSPEEINVVQHTRSLLSGAPSFVDLDDPNSVIRPISVRNRSPSISHRSVVLPPDGYIPTLGENNSILLPPPHELSNPVPMSVEVNHVEEGQRDQAAPTKFRDYAYPGGMKHGNVSSQNGKYRDDDVGTVSGRGKVPTMSTSSVGSTHISQLDLVSPPRDKGKEKSSRSRRRGKSRDRDRESESVGRSGKTRARTQPEQIVEEWRSHNSEILRSLTPSAPSPAPSKQQQQKGGSVYAGSMRKRSGGTLIERPKTTEPTHHSSRGSTSSRMQNHDQPIPNAGPVFDRHVASAAGQFMRGRDAAPRSPPHREPFRPMTPAGQRGMAGPTPDRAATPNNWSKPKNQPEAANAAVPNINIDIESPSGSSASPAAGSVVDPVLLSPEYNSRPVTPAQSRPREPGSHIYSGIYAPQTPVNIHAVLQDNNLPPGFVPLSPIPSRSNLTPYYSPDRSYEPFIPPGLMDSAAQRGAAGFDTSPAPLNRPISLFSDS